MQKAMCALLCLLLAALSGCGGAAVNEQMRLAGITPGASLAPTDEAFFYGVLIPVSEIRLCLRDWVRM